MQVKPILRQAINCAIFISLMDISSRGSLLFHFELHSVKPSVLEIFLLIIQVNESLINFWIAPVEQLGDYFTKGLMTKSFKKR